MFSRKKEFFTPAENELVVNAIRSSEARTSGEVRVYVESRNPYMDPLDRAREIFADLHMQETADRNAVLVYVAVKDREVALFGDEGIHQKVGTEFWNKEVNLMLSHFKENHPAAGLAHCIQHIGDVLIEKFPYDAKGDKNELPDEIVFGK